MTVIKQLDTCYFLVYIYQNEEEPDKLSDIEQQSPSGDSKKSNTLPQMKEGGGGRYKTNVSYHFYKV